MLILITLTISFASAADINDEAITDSSSNDVIGISNGTSQINSMDVSKDISTENQNNADENMDLISLSNDKQDLLGGDMDISVIGVKKDSYNVGESVNLKMGTQKSSYTPADIYIQVEGGSYTDNPVGKYSDATSSNGVSFTFTTPGTINLRFVQLYYNNYYFSDYMSFNVVEAGPAIVSGSYTDLQNLIDNADGVLDLPYDFAYNESYDNEYKDGVLVSKNIVINGNGHSISGENLAKIFDVWKADVVISNVTLTNGNSNNGGAIIVSNSITSLTLKDSTIKNSNGNQGGAIHVMSGILSVENTEFINNTAKTGGAIYHNAGSSTLTVKDSLFEDNKATSTGTAGGAGAINMNAGKLIVENTKFNGNTVTADGGAIALFNFASGLTVNNSEFRRNTASKGGAIYAQLTSANMIIVNSNFTDNAATSQAGAVYLQGSGIAASLDNVKFTNNTAESAGALANKLATTTIEKTIFENNTATEGGAISASGKISINNSELTNNKAATAYNIYQTEENIVSVENSRITLENPTFNINEEYLFTDEISLNGILNNGIYNQAFTLTYTIDTNSRNVTIAKNKNEFTIDLGILKAGEHTIAVKSFTDETGNTYIVDSEKTFNVIGPNKGTFAELQYLIDNAENILELTYDFKYDSSYDEKYSEGVLVSKDLTINGNGHTISGENLAKIFDVWKADVVISNVTLTNGNSNNGGAIIVSNSITSLTLKDSTIKDSASNQGGAIHVMSGTLSVENTEFINNTAKTGGAIYHNAGSSTLTVKDSLFEDNKATSTGTAGGAGAINMNAGKLIVENTKFNDNTAVSNGGAISISNFANTITVTGSKFNGNSANDGGAIYAALTKCDLSINDSNFTENTANNQGGAVYVQGQGIATTLDNVKFINNTAKEGGALVNKLGSATVEKSTFEDNKASIQGGAILASGKVTVNESSFTNNQATSDYNVYQIGDNVISIENIIITVSAPSFNVKESYENGENILIEGTFESGINNKQLTLPYSLNTFNSNTTIDKNNFKIDLGNALSYGVYTISIESFTDESGNVYTFETVEKTFTVKVEVKTSDDLQALIDNALEGSVIELGNYSFENISNVNITKNITIKGSEGTIISSAGDGTPIFNVPAKSENGPSGFTITDVNFIVNNGDTIVKVTADNATDENAIDNPEINIINNTITKANDDVIGKSVTVLELDSERTNLAPTNAINIAGNKLDDDVKAFQFEITSLSDGNNFNIPSIEDKKTDDANVTATNEKVPSIITCPAKTTTAIDTKVDGKKGVYYQLTLKDNNQSALANKSVKIILDNVIYTLKTDLNGVAKLQLNIKKSGTYTLFATFLGDDKYNSSFSSAKIKINKQKMKLTVSKKTFKVKAKKKVVKVTLKTSKGKGIKGKKVSLKIKGKTYTAKTNKKGVAKIKIKLKKRGTFKGTIKVPTDNTYKQVTKKINIKIK